MAEGLGQLLDLAKSLMGGATDKAENTVDAAKDGGADLMGMAKGLLGNVSQGDMQFLDIAKNLLGKMDSPIDIVSALKDGKVDISDLISMGSVISKLMK